MEAMIANDSEKEWMTPLLEFRNEIGDESIDKSRRDFRRRGGFIQGYNSGCDCICSQKERKMI